MAQALPRFCPRCGTPTQANMHRCATCGLPVEAMLAGSGRRSALPGESDDAALLETRPELPTPRQGQPGNQPPYGLATPSNPALSTPVSPFSPMEPRSPQARSTSNRPVNNPSSNPGVTPWSEQNQQPFPNSPPPVQTPRPIAGNMSNNPDALPAWEALHRPVNNPGVTPWSEQNQQPFPNSPPTTQTPWPTTGNPVSNPGIQPAWLPPTEQTPFPDQIPVAPRRKRWPLVIILIGVILLLLGAGGYLAFLELGGSLPQPGQTQAQIKTTSLNTSTVYAGMDVTLLNAQQSQNFLDDPHTASDGMLRLHLQEQNKTAITINWDYTLIAQLIASGTTNKEPVFVQSKQSIAPGATQSSIIDFAIANGGNLSELSLQLGAAREAKIQVPLIAQANLSQYQPKTTPQNGPMLYFGLNWTLTSSTTSLSIPGQQATVGMEYLTLNLTVDNTLSQEAITGSPFDYIQLQTGGKTISPVSSTLPVSFATGEKGQAGTATFLIPQKSNACSLLLLSQDPGETGQASTNFQLG